MVDGGQKDPGSAEAPTSGDGGAAPVGKGAFLTLVGGTVFIADLITKWWVVQSMTLGASIPVLGDVVRLTYIRNPGAAFGIHLGDHSRLIFGLITVLAVAFLGWMYAGTPPRDRLRLLSLSLLLAGALGNLVDRIRSPDGVVDFIDVGIGTLRWPVFNVADSAITVGAILLAITLWQEESEARRGDGEGGARKGAGARSRSGDDG